MTTEPGKASTMAETTSISPGYPQVQLQQARIEQLEHRHGYPRVSTIWHPNGTRMAVAADIAGVFAKEVLNGGVPGLSQPDPAGDELAGRSHASGSHP